MTVAGPPQPWMHVICCAVVLCGRKGASWARTDAAELCRPGGLYSAKGSARDAAPVSRAERSQLPRCAPSRRHVGQAASSAAIDAPRACCWPDMSGRQVALPGWTG